LIHRDIPTAILEEVDSVSLVTVFDDFHARGTPADPGDSSGRSLTDPVGPRVARA